MDPDQPTNLTADQATEQTTTQTADLSAGQATDQSTTQTAGKAKDPNIGNIPQRWKVLSGSTDWKKMLDPLDDDLRRYLIHYGERAMATYEALNTDIWSQNTGNCRYSKEELFVQVGLIKGHPFSYNITKYIFATSSMTGPSPYIYKSLRKDAGMKQTNWIGYVAVATDQGKSALGRRDILVAWRGTVQLAEWFKDADAALVPAGKDLFPGSSGVMLHRGFRSLYVDSNQANKYSKTSARQQVLSEVKRLAQMYKNEEASITVAGHSLGAALGTINAVDIVSSKTNQVGGKGLPVTAFVFATPNNGNMYFKELAKKLPVKILRIRNMPDIVPAVPPVGLGGYMSVGEELQMSSMTSNYLNNPGDIAQWHDLEVYLHMVAGTQGVLKQFKFGNVKRDIALVNKYTAALKSQYLVPPYWRVTANRNMVQQPDGSWKLDDMPHYLANDDDDDDDQPQRFANDDGESSAA